MPLVTHPVLLSDLQNMGGELWHFMYKNTVSSQVCCSTPSKPFISLEEQSLLYRSYFRVSDLARRAKTLRLLLAQQEQFTVLAWVGAGRALTSPLQISGSFELHAAFSPLASPAAVTETAEKLLRFLRKEEKRVFFCLSPGLLNH